MSTTLTAESTYLGRVQALFPCLRAGESAAVVFFLYMAGMAWVRHLGVAPRLVLALLPVAVTGLAVLEAGRTRAWTRVVRDQLSMGLILAAYWSVGWFEAPPLAHWQEAWLGWDRMVLDTAGLRAGIESLGIVIPSLLECTYLMLYAIPPICVGILYRVADRERVHRFLFRLLLGTLSVYAMLPLFPVHGPHVAYPLLDLPHVNGIGRGINVWVLDHMDIPTSVFPSGHVGVAFSCAAGMFEAVRSRPAIWGGVLTAAILVYLATVYCRYHYAVDGLASIAIVGAVSLLARRGGTHA